MKKNKFKFIILISIMLLVTMCNIYAVSSGFDPSVLNTSDTNITTPSTRLSTPISRFVGTIMLLFQVLSLGGIVFAGVRYMFKGAEGKAQIKSDMLKIVVGCVIVFGASTIATLITKIADEAL